MAYRPFYGVDNFELAAFYNGDLDVQNSFRKLNPEYTLSALIICAENEMIQRFALTYKTFVIDDGELQSTSGADADADNDASDNDDTEGDDDDDDTEGEGDDADDDISLGSKDTDDNFTNDL